MKKILVVLLVVMGGLLGWIFWPSINTEAKIQNAYAWQKSDDHAMALKELDEILKKNPQHLQALKARIESAYLLGLYDDVLRDIKSEAIQTAHKQWANLMQTKVLINTRHYDEAITSLLGQIAENGGTSQIYGLLSTASRLKGDDETALIYREKALKLEEEHNTSVTKP